MVLACDHRAVDGAYAAGFLEDLRQGLERPRDLPGSRRSGRPVSRAAPPGAPVLSLGEALVEFMPEPAGQSMRDAVDWRKYAGGGPATYAAAVVRCGRPAALITRLGDDAFSDFLVDALAEEGVDVSRIIRVPGRQAGICFHECIEGRTTLAFQRRHSAATTLAPEDIDPAAVAGAAALHVPGTTLQISDGALEASLAAIAAARDAGVPVSFDPNVRALPGAAGTAAAFDEAVAAADVVTPTLEEAAAITGREDPVEAGRELLARGPRSRGGDPGRGGLRGPGRGRRARALPRVPRARRGAHRRRRLSRGRDHGRFPGGLGAGAHRRHRQRCGRHRRDRHGPLRAGPADAGPDGGTHGYGGKTVTDLRIALAQTRQTADRQDNRRAILEAMDQAGKQEVRILCFPETQTCGYRVDIAEPTGTVPVAWLEEVHEEVAGRCARFGMACILGTEVRSESGRPYNSALVIGEDGCIRGAHHKTMLTPLDAVAYEPGTGAHTFSPLRRHRGRGHLLRGPALRRAPQPSARAAAPSWCSTRRTTPPAPTTGRSPCTTP